MIGDTHEGVIRIDSLVWRHRHEPVRVDVPPGLKERIEERRTLSLVSGELTPFLEALAQMICRDIAAAGADFDMGKYEVEITAKLQPIGTNKRYPVTE